MKEVYVIRNQSLSHFLSAAAESTPIYFYHPDHLGTSTFLTDANGNAYQFFLNLPFGETMAEQKGSLYYNTPYKFNGKELDEETGLYYYGARYFDPRTSIWLSVDPKFAKYPNFSPYNYCLGNPINLVDPDGMDPIPITSYNFIKFANKLGIYGNQKIGAFFERLCIASLQSTEYGVVHNQSINFPSPVRVKMNNGLPGSVRPDGITERFGDDSYSRTFISPAFYEAKATNASITKNYRKGQITGMIDAVSNLNSSVGGVPSLTLITTSNTEISDSIKDYASERGVMLYQSIAAIDDETGEFIISDREWLNRDNAVWGIGGAGDRIKRVFDWDNYDSYNGVDPRSYINQNSNQRQDPDPCTINEN